MFDPRKEGPEQFCMHLKKKPGHKIKEDKKRESEYSNRPLDEAFMDKMKEDADDEYDGGHF